MYGLQLFYEYILILASMQLYENLLPFFCYVFYHSVLENLYINLIPVSIVIFLLESIFIFLFCKFVIQMLNHVQLFAALWTAAHQASLSFTSFRSLLKPMSIESVLSSIHPILCLLSSPSFPAFSLSRHHGLF